MSLIAINGHLLEVNGHLTTDPNCCCGCCPLPTNWILQGNITSTTPGFTPATLLLRLDDEGVCAAADYSCASPVSQVQYPVDWRFGGQVNISFCGTSIGLRFCICCNTTGTTPCRRFILHTFLDSDQYTSCALQYAPTYPDTCNCVSGASFTASFTSFVIDGSPCGVDCSGPLVFDVTFTAVPP